MPTPTLYRDNSKPRNLLEALQAAVINRYTKPYGGHEPIVYEFTQDRALIHQYHRLLEAMYSRIYAAQNFVADDVYDKLSYVLVARRGRLCLGGCRLTVREYDERWKLPLESEGFIMRDVFPELPLDSVRHGEISRFAIMEDAGDEDIFHGLCKVMYQKVIELQVHYLFAKSTYTLARNWRLIANSLGVKTTKICDHLNVPEHPAIPDQKWYVTLSNLSSLYPVQEEGQYGAAQEKMPPKAPEPEVNRHLSLID
jgi:hypothetical protein